MVPFRQRVVALLIWFLSRNIQFAVYYLHCCTEDEFPEDPAHLAIFLFDWFTRRAVCDAVIASIADLNDRYRVLCDEFLVRSLVAEFVISRNARGEIVPSTEAIHKYLGYWALRAVPARVQGRLARLTWHRNSRRKFGVLLRKEWLLHLSSCASARELSQAQLREAVFRETEHIDSQFR